MILNPWMTLCATLSLSSLRRLSALELWSVHYLTSLTIRIRFANLWHLGSMRGVELHVRLSRKPKGLLVHLLRPLKRPLLVIGRSAHKLRVSLHLLFRIYLNISLSSFGPLYSRRRIFIAQYPPQCLHNIVLHCFLMALFLRTPVSPLLEMHLFSLPRKKSSGFLHISSGVVLPKVRVLCPHRW